MVRMIDLGGIMSKVAWAYCFAALLGCSSVKDKPEGFQLAADEKSDNEIVQSGLDSSLLKHWHNQVATEVQNGGRDTLVTSTNFTFFQDGKILVSQCEGRDSLQLGSNWIKVGYLAEGKIKHIITSNDRTGNFSFSVTKKIALDQAKFQHPVANDIYLCKYNANIATDAQKASALTINCGLSTDQKLALTMSGVEGSGRWQRYDYCAEKFKQHPESH